MKMMDEHGRILKKLDAILGILTPTSACVSEQDVELAKIRAAFLVFANLLNNTDPGKWAWDEMSNDMQEAWNELCEAVRA